MSSFSVRVLTPIDAEAYRYVRLCAEQETFSSDGTYYDEHLMTLELNSCHNR